jgi:photosystem II stability/assembly factor-like uncharacterized protein
VFEGVATARRNVPPGNLPGKTTSADLGSINSTYSASLIAKYGRLMQMGKTVTAGIFDEGAIRDKLAAFMNGANSRVVIRTSKGPSDHSTEVAIVLAARGPDPRSLGVAWNLGRLLSFDQDNDLKDLAERAGADQIVISNHSYVDQAGWWFDPQAQSYCWFGGADNADDERFGKYGEKNCELDRILCAQNQLISFVAAGNQRSYIPAGTQTQHWAWLPEVDPATGQRWKQMNRPRRPNRSPTGGVDTIAGLGLSKNAMCVGAVDQFFSPYDRIVSADFSSWGPADDGRVKPDVVAAGQNVWVELKADGELVRVDGTSFAAPTVAGVAALLVELFRTVMNRPPTSAEIKGLLIHTARDVGLLGPDPIYGWGTVNAILAGDVIMGGYDPGRQLLLGEVGTGPPNSLSYVRPEENERRVRVTLAWIDPPAPANDKPVNDRTPALVNDLDVELEAPDGTLFYPYRLNPEEPLQQARSDAANTVDNVEVIDAFSGEVEDADPGRGEWKVRVKAARLAQGSTQKYALIVSAVPDNERPGGPSVRRRHPKATRPREIVETALVVPSEPRPARGGWTFLGPFGLGGTTRTIAIDPRDPNAMWLGCESGGIWSSRDGAQSWTPIDDPILMGLPVCTLALDPVHPGVLYAGTGQGDYSLEAHPGAGIFRSDDGGNTWNRLESTREIDFRYVNRLAVSQDGSTLLAATRNGLFRSPDEGRTFSRAQPPADVEMLDVALDPVETGRCVAAGRALVVYSTDGGITWVPASGLPAPGIGFVGGRIALTYARANPEVVYASVDNNSGEVYRSDNGGKTFSLCSRGVQYLGGEGWYDNMIWAGDPTDASLVVVGGIDLYRSKDGGKTLTKISDWTANPVSPGYHQFAIVASPNYDGRTVRTVFSGNGSGVYRTDDITRVAPNEGWRAMNHGYSATKFNGAAGSPVTGTIVGGSRGSGVLVRAGDQDPATWSQMTLSKGGYCAVDPIDKNFIYAEYVYLQIIRSTDGGRSSHVIIQGIADAGDPSRANWIAPFVLDPNDANTMLAGGSSLWRSTTVKAATPQWLAIKDEAGSPISAIAVAPRDSQIIWVGHNDGQIYKTREGKAARPRWSRVDQGGTQLPNRYCTRIVLDPVDPAVAYVTFGSYERDNVWKTTNGGLSFESIDPTPAPVYSLAIHPDRSQSLYLGTEVGIFTSSDGGSTWDPANVSPVNSPVRELFWMKKHLVAATYGRGMFQIDVSDVGK